MFIKVGEPSPITVVDPIDIDDESTKKSLKKAIKTIKNMQKNEVPAQVKKESEKK